LEYVVYCEAFNLHRNPCEVKNEMNFVRRKKKGFTKPWPIPIMPPSRQGKQADSPRKREGLGAAAAFFLFSVELVILDGLCNRPHYSYFYGINHS
jgi:hypothetical protein